MCFGCTCQLYVGTFGTVLGRYCEFSNKNWILFCDWSLDFCQSKVCWFLDVVFHLSILLNYRCLNLLCLVVSLVIFILVRLFKIFHQVWEFFVVCWQFIFSRGSVVLHLGCRIIYINRLSCWIVQGFVLLFTKLYVICTFFSSKEEIYWKF